MRPICCSIAVASTFIITSTQPFPKPNSTMPMSTTGTDPNTVAPSPTRAMPVAKVSIARSMPRRAPVRAMTAGLVEMPRMDATPMPRRLSPTWAWSRSRAVLMPGTREAQVAIERPLARKMAKIAVRQRTNCERVRAVSMADSLSNRFDLGEPNRAILGV